MLTLERPLAFIDVESTGLDPRTARIVRLTVLKLMPDGTEQVKSVLIRPGEPISPGAIAVHGLADADVQDAPPFRAYARALAANLDGCDLAGFGIERFDLPLLEAEFERAGIKFSLESRAVVDAMAVFHKLEPRDLRSAFSKYVGAELPDFREPDTGVRASLAILRGQLTQNESLPTQPNALARWLRGDRPASIDPEGKFVWSPDGEALINFGRYRGHRLADLAESKADYLAWVASNNEFGEDVRRIATSAIEGDVPRRDQ